MDYLAMFLVVTGISLLFVIGLYAQFKNSILTKIGIGNAPCNIILVMAAYTIAKVGIGSIASILLIIAGSISFAAFMFYLNSLLRKHIKLIAEGAQRFAVGDIVLDGMDFNEIGKINARNDELGDIGKAFINLIEYLKTRSDVANEIAHGNMDVTLEVASGNDVLSKSMLEMRDNINTVIDETVRVSKIFTNEGDIEARPDLSLVEGSYREMLQNVSTLMTDFVSDMLEVIGGASSYADGNFEFVAKNLAGKKIVLTNAFNKLRQNLLAVIDEGVEMAKAAEHGQLSRRGDISKFDGDFKKIIGGFNNTVENIMKPVNEAVDVLKEMSKGNLNVEMRGDYSGDHAIMKNALNTTIDSLNNLIIQANTASAQVNSGAIQVSDASQSLSQGATEQASSLEEVTSSITEISSQTRTNAENARQANILTDEAQEAANKGNSQMDQMLEAMNSMIDSSSEIGKIIKVIDDIAFQTNLLSLNAAVEAARAGVHGKGFAVVAEEVRSLAQRSAKAAKETSELIESSIKRVEVGSAIADETAKSLTNIIEGITRASDLVSEIASASNEQALAIDQISDALGQIDGVTQSNTSNAEESAAAAEELSGQANQLMQLIAMFQLKDSMTTFDASHAIGSRKRSLNPASGIMGKEVPPDQVLDDFGDF